MLHVLKTVFHLKSKQESPKKGHTTEHFRPKWPKMAQNRMCMPLFLTFLF